MKNMKRIEKSCFLFLFILAITFCLAGRSFSEEEKVFLLTEKRLLTMAKGGYL